MILVVGKFGFTIKRARLPFPVVRIPCIRSSNSTMGRGIWLSTKADTDCEEFLLWPIIIISTCLLLLSLAGYLGLFCKVPCLLRLYYFGLFLIILFLFFFTIFAFVVTNKGAGEAVSERGYKEYRLGNYSHWLQKLVEKSSNWHSMKSCLQDTKVCKSLSDKSANETAEIFFKRNLSPTQSGCCKPPTSCGFIYVSATNWTTTTTATNTSDPDCTTWSNDQDKLCYDCSSCKASVLANLNHDLRKNANTNIWVLGELIVLFSIGCCVIPDMGRDKRDENYGY